MTQPYLGEVRMFAGNFAPRTNAYCSGQLISIQQNTALFSLFGTYYGGNGTTTFGLPDLRGRLPVGMGQGPGLSNYNMGQAAGTESITLTLQQIPSHTHIPTATSTVADQNLPNGNIPAALANPPWTGFWVADGKQTGTPETMAATAVGTAGHGQSHENRMPSLAISFIVALQGIFPSRN